jgi:hypothetical protein
MQVFRRFASGGASDGGWEAPPMPPAAASVFAGDFSIRSVVDPAETFEAWIEHDRAGHFPALEAPELLLGDIRAFFAGRS